MALTKTYDTMYVPFPTVVLLTIFGPTVCITVYGPSQ